MTEPLRYEDGASPRLLQHAMQLRKFSLLCLIDCHSNMLLFVCELFGNACVLFACVGGVRCWEAGGGCSKS